MTFMRSQRAAVGVAVISLMALSTTGCGKPATHDALIKRLAIETPLTKSDQVFAAFGAAFPKGDADTVGAGDDSPSDNGYQLTFAPKQIIPVGGDLIALISEGSDADACHACDGKLRVTYLKQAGDIFTPLNPPVQSTIAGDGFGVAPTWKLTMRKGIPALHVSTGYMDQGCTSSAVATYLLKPKAIVEDKAASRAGVEKCV